MSPRCPGKNERTFLCVLDADHAGPCVPYQPPDVDEWRAACVLLGVRRDDLRRPGVPKWTASIAGVGRGDGHTPMAAICALAERVSAALANGARGMNDPISLAASRLGSARMRLLRADSSTQRIQWSEEVALWEGVLADLQDDTPACDACAHSAPRHPVSQAQTIAEIRGLLDEDEPAPDLDAQVIAGVQRDRQG